MPCNSEDQSGRASERKVFLSITTVFSVAEVGESCSAVQQQQILVFYFSWT